MHKLVVNKPNRPKGSNVGVPGLGLFKNGEEYELDDEAVARYKATTGRDAPTVVGEPLRKEPTPTPPTPSPVVNEPEDPVDVTEKEDEF